jgi:hypothetical protein
VASGVDHRIRQDPRRHCHPGGPQLSWDYSPGDGADIDADLVARVNAAQQRVVIAAMVLTSHTGLDAIVAALGRGVPVSGVYDAGQVDPLVAESKKSTSPASAKALSQWTQIASLLVGKHSTPYGPDSPHDFLHRKVIVTDSTASTGSYNFSANAERNAENHLVLGSGSLAERVRPADWGGGGHISGRMSNDSFAGWCESFCDSTAGVAVGTIACRVACFQGHHPRFKREVAPPSSSATGGGVPYPSGKYSLRQVGRWRQ